MWQKPGFVRGAALRAGLPRAMPGVLRSDVKPTNAARVNGLALDPGAVAGAGAQVYAVFGWSGPVVLAAAAISATFALPAKFLCRRLSEKTTRRWTR